MMDVLHYIMAQPTMRLVSDLGLPGVLDPSDEMEGRRRRRCIVFLKQHSGIVRLPGQGVGGVHWEIMKARGDPRKSVGGNCDASMGTVTDTRKRQHRGSRTSGDREDEEEVSIQNQGN